MIDSPDEVDKATRTNGEHPLQGNTGLAELRSLLVGPEQQSLKALQARLDDSTLQTRTVSRVLADAIALRDKDPKLTRALAPSIEEAITTSVRRDPRPLADALFPVIGPAIRKAIAHTMASMMESFSRTLDLSLSWRALGWRLTALRTGKSFAEVALLNTLEYRVEQVFLIHRESGLPLLHATLASDEGKDADQISGMLTAIRDFVQDSFGGLPEETLDALRVGELAVYIEQGPDAVLAAVVRGTAPLQLRATLQETIETIHRRYSTELESFRGDASPFAPALPILEECLVARFRPSRRGIAYGRWIVAGVLLLGAGLWMDPRCAISAAGMATSKACRRNLGSWSSMPAAGRAGSLSSASAIRSPLTLMSCSPDPAFPQNGSTGAGSSIRHWMTISCWLAPAPLLPRPRASPSICATGFSPLRARRRADGSGTARALRR